MPEPTFDADGYPTEETLNAILTWANDDLRGLVEYVRRAWSYQGYWLQLETRKGLDVRVSTGGWSGNESLIGAMRKHPGFWALCCWYENKRGGHFRFLVRRVREHSTGDGGADRGRLGTEGRSGDVSSEAMKKICDGCAVRELWEHRCHGADVCACQECRYVEGFLPYQVERPNGDDRVRVLADCARHAAEIWAEERGVDRETEALVRPATQPDALPLLFAVEPAYRAREIAKVSGDPEDCRELPEVGR